MANYSIHGVGDQGVVLVLLGLEEDGENGRNERMVMISLPEKEVDQLKEKLIKRRSLWIFSLTESNDILAMNFTYVK